MAATRRIVLFGLAAAGAAWSAAAGRDLLDRAVPAAAAVVPLESWTLGEAKHEARAAALRDRMRRATAADLAIVGDSHAQYADDPGLFPGLEVLNLGIAGDTTVGVLRRLEPGVAARRVVLEIGYNDLKYRGTAATADNVGRIVAAIRAGWPGPPVVVVQGLFPVAASRPYANGRIRELNGRLRALCAARDCAYLDVTRDFAGIDGGLDVRYSADGVHLNAAGNRRWAARLIAQREDGR